MLIKSLVLKKEFLTTVKETVTLEDALKILEDSGFRCVPILDESGTIFRGNIYKMHIYRHKSQGGDMSLPVTYLLKNATKTIPVNAPFFKVFFNIKDLPYIAVLDENANFYGILTHAKLLGMLSEAWNVDVGSYVLTVMSTGERGDLAKRFWPSMCPFPGVSPWMPNATSSYAAPSLHCQPELMKTH